MDSDGAAARKVRKERWRAVGVQQILHQMTVATPGRGFTRLDGRLNTWIRSTGLDQGVLHLTCLHTSASLTINENADPRVLQDLDAWMADAVPEHRRYLHDDEGLMTCRPTSNRAHQPNPEPERQQGATAAGHLASRLPLGAPQRCSHQNDRLPPVR